MKVDFYIITDHEDDRASYGRTVAVAAGEPIAYRYWSTSSFYHCPRCGRWVADGASAYEAHEAYCSNRSPHPSDVEGWEKGELVEGKLSLELLRQLEEGKFFPA